jgi:hypothetical protein
MAAVLGFAIPALAGHRKEDWDMPKEVTAITFILSYFGWGFNRLKPARAGPVALIKNDIPLYFTYA